MTTDIYRIYGVNLHTLQTSYSHILHAPMVGQVVEESLVLRGKIKNVPLKQIKVLNLKKGSNPKGRFSNSKGELEYQISVATNEILDFNNPLQLAIVLQDNQLYVLAEIEIVVLRREQELTELAVQMLQANDLESCKAGCERILAVYPNTPNASALLNNLSSSSNLVTLQNQNLLIKVLAHEGFGCEYIAELAQKYQLWKLALTYWDEIISRTKLVDTQWLVAKGDVLIKTKRYVEAEQFFKQIKEQVPQLPLGYVGLAYVAQQQENWELALVRWGECIQRFPHEKELIPNWLIRKIEIYTASKKFEQATTALQSLIQQYPKLALIPYHRLIELELKQQNWDKAIEYCNLGIEKFPTTESLYRQLINILYEQNKLDEAIQYYQNQIVDKPFQVSLLMRLAYVLQEKRELEAALTAYQQIKQMHTLPNWLHSKFVRVLVELGKLQDAETELQQQFATPEQYVELLEGLASLAMHAAQFDLALERWQELITLQPNYIAAYLGKANALLFLKQYEAARAVFEQLLVDYPNSSIGPENLANIAVQQGNFELALHYYNIAILRSTDNTWLQINKADILVKLFRLEEAKPIYERFVDKSQGLAGLAKIARLSGKFEECLEFCQQLMERFPSLVIGYQEAEQAYIELGEFAKAKQAFLAYSSPQINQAAIPKRTSSVMLPDDLILPEIKGKNNDYTFIEEKLDAFIKSGQAYTLPVSIIIPVYNRKVLLAKTLAALTHQTYPKELMEVVIADDGSSDGVEEVIEKYRRFLNLQYIYQPDEGFRLSAVRNLGMKAARHDYFIILDCDVLPVPQLVEAYMKYFHVSDRIAMMGPLRFICSDTISDDDILKDTAVFLELPDIKSSNDVSTRTSVLGITFDWRLPLFVRTNNEKEERWPFRGFVGANMVHTRKAIDEIGGYDEEFQAWGHEDVEMGYRLYNAGYYFIPVMEAIVLHQEPENNKNDSDRVGGKIQTDLLFEEKCPVPLYRKYQKGRMYKIPKVSIYIPAYNAEKYIKAAIDSALNQTYTDLEVCICNDGSTDNTLNILEENYTNNPRVRWLSQPNGGTAKASNTAVRMCRGTYIGQLDADDMLKPRAVELAVNYLDNHDVGCVYSSLEMVDAEGNFVRLGHSAPFSREGLLHGMIFNQFRCYRKRDWLRTEGFAEDLETTEDYDLALKLAEVCDIHHIDKVTYQYRWHGDNTSIVKRKQQEKDHVLVINRSLQRMGLSKWEAVSADASNQRVVKFQLKEEVPQQDTDKSVKNVCVQDIICLIVTCEKYLWRANAVRNTWLKEFKKSGGRYYFLMGNPALNYAEVIDDILYVPCRDDYESLPLKLALGYQFVYENLTFSHICKIDDDVFLNVDNFVQVVLPQLVDKPFAGARINKQHQEIINTFHFGKCSDDRFHKPLDFNVAPCDYPWGFIYFLSKEVIPFLIEKIAVFQEELKQFHFSLEDIRFAEILYANGVSVWQLNRFISKEASHSLVKDLNFTVVYEIKEAMTYQELYELSLENKPKLPIIQSLWIGNTLSTLEQLSITSFLKNGHEFHLYVYDEVLNIPAGTILKDANEIIPKAKIIVHKETGSYALFADIFRYKLLLIKGNYWVDTDVICLKPFDINRDYVFAVERSENYQEQKIASCVIKVPANSAIMNYCYEQAISTINVENLAWGTIGPDLIHQAVVKYHLQEYAASYLDFCPIYWWEHFKLIDGKTPIPVDSYAIHFWNEMWRRNGLDKDAIYTSSSIYSLLKAKYLAVQAESSSSQVQNVLS